jgi:hypothetical protein
MSPCPGGHHSSDGSGGQLTGVRSSSRSLGSLVCRKSSGRSPPMSGYAPSASSVSSRVRYESMNISGSRTPCRRRSDSTCRTMMSRKLRPSLTSSSDLARSIPIEVASPPLSLTTTVRSSARVPSSSLCAAVSRAGLSSGSMVDSGTMPVSPSRSRR